jgi:hypothetical protein
MLLSSREISALLEVFRSDTIPDNTPRVAVCSVGEAQRNPPEPNPSPANLPPEGNVVVQNGGFHSDLLNALFSGLTSSGEDTANIASKDFLVDCIACRAKRVSSEAKMIRSASSG